MRRLGLVRFELDDSFVAFDQYSSVLVDCRPICRLVLHKNKHASLFDWINVSITDFFYLKLSLRGVLIIIDCFSVAGATRRRDGAEAQVPRVRDQEGRDQDARGVRFARGTATERNFRSRIDLWKAGAGIAGGKSLLGGPRGVMDRASACGASSPGFDSHNQHMFSIPLWHKVAGWNQPWQLHGNSRIVLYKK